MKTVLSVIIFALITSLPGLRAQDYQISFNSIFEGSENGNIQHIKSVVDSKGNLHIVFLDGSTGHAYYANNISGSWKSEILSYFDKEYNEDVDISSYPNIAIDRQDNISIIMFGRYKEDLLFATRPISASKWEFKYATEYADLLKFNMKDELSDMCIDNNGGLHVYCCATVWDKDYNEYWMSAVYFYKAKASNKWKMEIIKKGFDGNSYAADPSISSAGDKVYLTIGGEKDLHFASKNINEGQWKIEDFGIFSDPGTINSWKFETSLATKPDGSPIWAFYDYGSGDDNTGLLNWFYGLNVMGRSTCNNGEWLIDHNIDDPAQKRNPAIAVDSKGKVYLALGGQNPYLYAQSCGCKESWEKLFDGGDDREAEFTDIVIDKNDVVHAFYADNYTNKVFYLKATPKSSTMACNGRPKITAYTGKTNVAPGEKWTGTITAIDPDCDPIEFYCIIKADHVTLTDHGNGTATVTSDVPVGEGFGDVGFAVFCMDDKHEEKGHGNHSAIKFMLKLTQEGKDEGKITIDNRCVSANASIPVSSINSIWVEDRDAPLPFRKE